MKTNLSFQQATEELRNFLVSQRQPADIQWIFREDIFQHKRLVFLRWPLPKGNGELAKELYGQGRNKGLGLALEALCFEGKWAFCYVLVPEDESAADALMMTDLKLSYRNERLTVIKIRSKLLWYLVKTYISRHPQFYREELIPLRDAI